LALQQDTAPLNGELMDSLAVTTQMDCIDYEPNGMIHDATAAQLRKPGRDGFPDKIGAVLLNNV